MDTIEKPAIELRYQVGGPVVWTATEPGFYAMLCAMRWYDQPTASIAKLVSEFEYSRFISQKSPWSVNGWFCPGSVKSEHALLGPYDTPEEARAALKIYAFMLCATLTFPGAVFEEPDGTTIPLNEWRQMPD